VFDAGRLEPNNYLTIALAGSLGIQGATMIVPGLRTFLGLSPMGPLDIIVSIGSAVVPLLINEATKKTVALLPETTNHIVVPVMQPAGNGFAAVT
jgi:Ca2+-transporting ATPase